MGKISVCPHIYELHGPNHSTYGPGWEDNPTFAIRAAIFQALKACGNTEVHGACCRCPTDFSLRACADFAELRVWQDLGPESSPRDLAWRVQVSGTYDDSQSSDHNNPSLGPSVPHEPGSIRRLYSGDDKQTNVTGHKYGLKR